MPADSVTPWQYANMYLDYEIGRGATAVSRMFLAVRGNQMRTYFTPMAAPNLKVPAFSFDLSPWQYAGATSFLYFLNLIDFPRRPRRGIHVCSPGPVPLYVDRGFNRRQRPDVLLLPRRHLQHHHWSLRISSVIDPSSVPHQIRSVIISFMMILLPLRKRTST